MTGATWAIPATLALLAGGGLAVVLEWRRLLPTPTLNVRKDIKRETLFVAQYGQAVCTGLVAWVVWLMEETTPLLRAAALITGVVAASLATWLVKRIAGRIRPGKGRDGHDSGAFLGPAWRSGGWRESFPSSHSACALALSAGLTVLYPQGAWAWWSIAGATAILRWMLDAHWLSDVLIGCAIGILCGWLAATMIA